MKEIEQTIVAVRGGGDVATGTIQKLYHAGFKVVILETARPLAIRRTVSLCSAVYETRYTVEDMTAVKVQQVKECKKIWEKGEIPLLVDPHATCLAELKPTVVIDAIIAKKNVGTTIDMAPIVIALGPGFVVSKDCDAIIETMRGHSLARVLYKGSAMPNTGIPGLLGGETFTRVVHSPDSGKVTHVKEIGDRVQKGEILFYVGKTPVLSPLTGTLRGEIKEGMTIKKGLKVADVDPRDEKEIDWKTISDKARNIGGASLDATLSLLRKL